MRLISILLSIILTVLALNTNVFAITIDYTESYTSINVSANFKSPFRTSSGNEQNKTVNEKFSQMRLWRGSQADTHEGVDFTASKGTNIYAVYQGVVKVVNTSNSDLKFVIIEHAIGSTYVYSVYVHLYTISVSVGDIVTENSIIGTSGPPDNDVYGYHLHFGITSNYSNTYSNLIWIPTYDFYKNSACFNNGRDLDYMYGFRYDGINKKVYLSGYFKGDSSETREAFNQMLMYYRVGSGNWQLVTMQRVGTSYEYSYDLSSLGFPANTIVQAIFVGTVTSTIDNAGGGFHWQYYPAKYKVPPLNPNSLSSSTSYVSMRILNSAIINSLLLHGESLDTNNYYEIIV